MPPDSWLASGYRSGFGREGGAGGVAGLSWLWVRAEELGPGLPVVGLILVWHIVANRLHLLCSRRREPGR